MEKVVPLVTDIKPEASVSGAQLLTDEYNTILSFNALRLMPDGFCHDAGCAVVRFEACSVSKFGYPNDEAWSGIPRTRGLGYGCYEVLNSPWNAEICELNKYSFPKSVPSTDRHFLFLFHDSSFECLARDFKLDVVPFDEFNQIALKFLKGEYY